MSSWAAVLIALAGLLGVLAGRLWSAARREGKIDAVLGHVVDMLDDHEDRIRFQEQRPPRRARRVN